MKLTKSITAQNQWSGKFDLLGDAHAPSKPARALISIAGGSTVTARRYSGSTVIQSLTMTRGMVLEVPVTGTYDIGVATGDYVDATTITVEQ